MPHVCGMAWVARCVHSDLNLSFHPLLDIPCPKQNVREGALVVLSEDFVLFLRHSTLCLELCHVTTSLREMRNVNNDNIPPPTLHIVCTLAVLIFHHKYCIYMAYMQMDCYCSCQHNSESLQQQ